MSGCLTERASGRNCSSLLWIGFDSALLIHSYKPDLMREALVVDQGKDGLPGAPVTVFVLATDAQVVRHTRLDGRRIELVTAVSVPLVACLSVPQ